MDFIDLGQVVIHLKKSPHKLNSFRRESISKLPWLVTTFVDILFCLKQVLLTVSPAEMLHKYSDGHYLHYNIVIMSYSDNTFEDKCLPSVVLQ